MRSDNRFSKVQGIGDLSQTLVETKKNVVYPLVYLLVKLALILLIATTSCDNILRRFCGFLQTHSCGFNTRTL